MTNSYFNYDDPAQSGTKVASAQFNNTMLAVQAGFDKLPTPTQLFYDNGRYGAATVVTTNSFALALPATTSVLEYSVGLGVLVQFPVANTGAAQINVNGMGLKEIRSPQMTALMANDLVPGVIYDLRYDGTYFQVTNIVASAVTLQTAGTVYRTDFGATTVGGICLLAVTTAQTVLSGTIVPAAQLAFANFAGTVTAGTIPVGSTWQASGSCTGSATASASRVTQFTRVT